MTDISILIFGYFLGVGIAAVIYFGIDTIPEVYEFIKEKIKKHKIKKQIKEHKNTKKIIRR